MGKLIGVFATEISSRVQGWLYKRLHEAAKNKGYNLVFFSADYSKTDTNATDKSASDLFAMAENIDFSAFIIHVQSIRENNIVNAVIEMGKRKNIPVFLYDCDSAGYTADNGLFTINLDYRQGFAECVKHVIEHHKCKRVYMLAGVKDNPFSEERIDAYREEMEKHGLAVDDDYIFYGDFWEIPAEKAMNDMLDGSRPLPEAICCANDSMAITAARVLERRGYRVPEDVIVTGFDGIEEGKYNIPVISTCQPVFDAVADFVFDAVEKNVRTGEFKVPIRFYPKESCGCENSAMRDDRIEMARIMVNNRNNTWQHATLSNMQLALMDSTELDEITVYMNGIMDMFKGYSHLYCIREDIESHEDFTDGFNRMRIQLNKNFLPEKEYDPFPAKNIIPDFENIFMNAGKDELFIIGLLKSVVKKYGYSVSRTEHYSTTQIKIYFQFNESFTNTIESILRNRRLEQAQAKLSEMYERMSETYIRDMMTGLYNRTGYYNELNEYLGREDMKDKFIHAINIDMDGMKIINDGYGHQEGDNAIKAVARAIGDCFAHPCISGRFGGDEFMVTLFSDSEDKPSREQISERMNGYLKNMPSLRDKKYSVGVSVGQAVCRVSDLKEVKDLEKQADDSMYEDKKRRKAGRK